MMKYSIIDVAKLDEFMARFPDEAIGKTTPPWHKEPRHRPRKSLDGTLAIATGAEPCVAGAVIERLTQEEAEALMLTAEWSEDPETGI